MAPGLTFCETTHRMNFDYIHQRLDDLQLDHRLRRLVPRSIDGIHLTDADGHELINFGSNDYLGLASLQRVGSVPTGSTASALVCGWTTLHEKLANELAAFESTEAAVLFPSGYAACSGTIATLAESGDLILSDELNHASLIDGCRLSRAECHVYPHRDVQAIYDILKSKRNHFARVWIVTDSVFSMDGHIAPLRELCDVADEFDACVVADEAHATGVLGPTGSGLCEELELKDRIPIRIGTLSKAVGGQGGFVVGPRVIIDYLVNRCRSLIFSTGLAPGAVQAALDALQIIQTDTPRRMHVRHLSKHLRQHLSNEESVSPLEQEIPIIPVILGEDQAAIDKARSLHEAGFFVPAIRPPTVPQGTSRLRISLSAAHTLKMVESLLATLS